MNLSQLLAKHEELLNALIHEDDAAVRDDLQIKLALLEEWIDEASA